MPAVLFVKSPEMEPANVLFLKAQVQQYTRSDGTTVQAHQDKRPDARQDARSRNPIVMFRQHAENLRNAKRVDAFNKIGHDLVGNHVRHIVGNQHARIAHAVASQAVPGDKMRQAITAAWHHGVIDAHAHLKMRQLVARAEVEHAAGSDWMQHKPYLPNDAPELR